MEMNVAGGIAKEYIRAISNSPLQAVAQIDGVNPVWHVFAVRHPDRGQFPKTGLNHPE